MELKHLAKIAYRIEPKPEGGFIARAADPAIPPLEALTREELLQKIQAKIAAELGSELAALKLPFGNKQVDVKIERQPGASLTLHSTDKNAQEELATLLQKNFPELCGVLVARDGDAKTFGNLNQQKDLVVNVSSQRFNITQAFSPIAWTRGGARDSQIENPRTDISLTPDPITPESSKNWTVLRFLLIVLLLAALVYFLGHR
jgi:hypothetical protein